MFDQLDKSSGGTDDKFKARSSSSSKCSLALDKKSTKPLNSVSTLAMLFLIRLVSLVAHWRSVTWSQHVMKADHSDLHTLELGTLASGKIVTPSFESCCMK